MFLISERVALKLVFVFGEEVVWAGSSLGLAYCPGGRGIGFVCRFLEILLSITPTPKQYRPLSTAAENNPLPCNNEKETINRLDGCYSNYKLCPTVYNPMDCSMPGFPALHYLPEFVQTHVHWVNDAIQLSYPLSPSSPVLSFPVSDLIVTGGRWEGVEAITFIKSSDSFSLL